ncbi:MULTISPECIES: MgtC/SapB family protein [Actinomadura]|uniref:MgtC/SapB family protein n=1 Tax=Actinomadura litoris TaxID=2678616 RepID=A0A7K1KU95_9ACTN|nr:MULTISPECIES: MgtC/SapB family protein [Actinomadura]MBT2207431.1 MgtC/SapB family protein [Actinomadura sp. NEAU-AAG7]MUN35760.1 MgtC/SapB family protein [Actinomadura litoris]
MLELAPGQGFAQIGELLLALVLSAAIGLERGLRNKSAGLRTHTLVGVGAALFMLVSKYGFDDVPGEHVSFDPSRVAAQIVSGIGFIGGGLIFVRRDAVRGLTTAAVVWVTAAVGMAAGGGLPVLAVAVTAGHFLVVYGLSRLSRMLPLDRFRPAETARLRLVYRDGRGALRRALMECTRRGFVVSALNVEREYLPDDSDRGRDERRDRREPSARRPGNAVVTLVLEGAGSVPELTAVLGELPDIAGVTVGADRDDDGE